MKREVRRSAASLLKLVELLFFPSFCHLCAAPLDKTGERAVCHSCLSALTPRHGTVCLCCGRFLDSAGADHLCRKCLERPPDFSRQRSCGQYGGVLKDLILIYKYRRVSVLSRPLALYAEQCLGSDTALWEGVDFIVPVPLHRKRKKERGFNQSELLAREMARIKNVPMLDKGLVKVKNAPPQTSLEGRAREANVRDAYAVKGGHKVRGKTVLVVDDVFTTGATLRECSHVLKKAGAREVRALTLAQA